MGRTSITLYKALFSELCDNSVVLEIPENVRFFLEFDEGNLAFKLKKLIILKYIFFDKI